MPESEGDKAGEGEAGKVSVFTPPRSYPFRDYASFRKPYFSRQEAGSTDTADAREVVVLRKLLEAKTLEHCRLQRSYELLEERLNVVLRQNQGPGKSGGGGPRTSWGARLLAEATSFLRR
jgi:hypothetical protein